MCLASLLYNIKKGISQNLINVQGPKTKKKIVVFESDDWGSIRMPSKSVYRELQESNYTPEKDPYLKYDSLASEEDLSALFDVLSSIKDKENKPACITANAVVANPDFEKIQQSDFQTYYFEPFTTTLQRYPNHANSFNLWLQGMNEGLFKPQYHGREHLNVFQWMKGLKENDPLLKTAFSKQMLSISSMESHMTYGYMEGLDFFSEEEKSHRMTILKEGAALFNKIFGYRSLSFIANCYIWDDMSEELLAKEGVKIIQGIAKQKIPQIDPHHHFQYVRHFMGQQNAYNQHYLIRNVFFEPSMDQHFPWIENCLERINTAFRWGKPAIIGSHRLNYIGSIEEKNRTNNLELLHKLLSTIVKRWPDVEFQTTDQLYNTYLNKKS